MEVQLTLWPDKTCTGCGRTQPRAEYGPKKGNLDGLSSRCRSCLRAYANRRYVANPEHHRQRVREYVAVHSQRVNTQRKARRQPVTPEQQAYNRRYHLEHLARHAELGKRWRIAHRDELRAKQAAQRLERAAREGKRRARQAQTRTEAVSYAAIWIRDSGICHICRLVVPESSRHFDHIIPLARGGTHTAANIAVAHALCNMKKHANILK